MNAYYIAMPVRTHTVRLYCAQNKSQNYRICFENCGFDANLTQN